MKKIAYIHPSIKVVCLRHHQLLMVSGVESTSTSNDVVLQYDKNGGNQGEAW